MHKYGFNLLWSDEDAGFIVTCPDFPGLSAFGETAEEALAEGNVALDLFVESLQESGDALPKATQAVEFSGQIRLRMPKTLHSSLTHKAGREGVSLNTWIITLLAETNSTAQFVDKVVDRLSSKIDKVHTAINAHAVESKAIRFQREALYKPEINEGGEYGRIKSSTVKWSST